MTNQKNITAGGTVVGGNLTQKTVNIREVERINKILDKLFKQYSNDKNTGKTTDTVVASLNEFAIETDPALLEKDLEQKLADAGRLELFKEGLIYKEMFRQKIERYRLFPSAQEIYAYLLGIVLTRFNDFVKPAIDEGLSTAEIKSVIHEQILEAITLMIPDAEPTCDYPSLSGMVYFLTGNCFIEWK